MRLSTRAARQGALGGGDVSGTGKKACAAAAGLRADPRTETSVGP